MTDEQESPFDQEAIQFIDERFAKCMLIVELSHIPEFVDLWRRARSPVSPFVEAIRPHLEAVGISLSPEARDAIIMSEKGSGLYDEQTFREAEVAQKTAELYLQAAVQAAETQGAVSEYQRRLEALLEPLGVPELVAYVVALDARIWGLLQAVKGPVSGPAADSLESTLLEAFTGLRPFEAASESPANISKRIARRTAPLRYHLERYDLEQRMHLWVRNVVFGEQIDKIAKATDYSEEWVRDQIRDAAKILGAKRATGRPKKGGVSQQWKMMSE